MNLADPELELIDPTPNIHNLFVYFDKLFFSSKLLGSGKVLVRWSKRMYSAAGVCSYEGRYGLCNIALSEPLLKLRPRKDLVETLLHEMIHALLFITNRDNDRDGHGPNFQKHMHRINREAGLNISIYHDFHDEVELYLKHWWRCNGRCQTMKPNFGVIRKFINQPPGPKDYWWARHQKVCGGTFIKIKEPEKPQKPTKKGKINADITKYINNNTNNGNKNTCKDVNKENKINTNINIIKIAVPHPTKLPEVNTVMKRTNSDSVIEKVRNVWVNKQIPTQTVTKNQTQLTPKNGPNINKHKANAVHVESPPKKIKKIDDYFITTASSILKDVYGKEFTVSLSNNNKLRASMTGDGDKIGAVKMQDNFVNCPTCNAKVKSTDINQHLDECLNKDIIEELSKEFIETTSTSSVVVENTLHQNKTRNSNNSFHTDIFPGPSTSKAPQMCFSCGKNVDTSMESHLRDCLGFFDNNTTIPEEGTCDIDTVIIEDAKPVIKIETSSDKENIVKQCPFCGINVNIPIELHLNKCLASFDNDIVPTEEYSNTKTKDTVIKEDTNTKTKDTVIKEDTNTKTKDTVIKEDTNTKTKDTVIKEDTKTAIKTQPSTSKENILKKCPFCRIKVDISIELHLDDCLGFFDNNNTVPTEGANVVETIVIDDDDDMFDETQTFNATGTKSPCPCCLVMVEIADMNEHLTECLSASFSLGV